MDGAEIRDDDPGGGEMSAAKIKSPLAGTRKRYETVTISYQTTQRTNGQGSETRRSIAARAPERPVNPFTKIPASRRTIAENLLGRINWVDEVTGYVACPGAKQHSSADGKRDCRVKLDGAPTIKCMHSSCLSVIEATNHQLRSAIGKAECTENPTVGPWRPTPEKIQEERQREQFRRLRLRTERSLPQIINSFACDVSDFWDRSPHRLVAEADGDWRLLMQLFNPEDVVWVGNPKDSGPGFASHFRPASEWLRTSTPPGAHICPSVFKPGAFSRSTDNIIAHKFLVIESDTLEKKDFCALVRWLEQILWLRALVDTGNRSIHSWWQMPPLAPLRELREVLPAIGCDKALFSPAHTCRLPGAVRKETGKMQYLHYLDLGAGR
jgi:hypothetical protein